MRRGKKKMIWLKVLLSLVLLGILAYLGLIGFVVYREKKVSTSAAALQEDYDAIIVLGAQILKNGEPNTQLEWRLDATLEFGIAVDGGRRNQETGEWEGESSFFDCVAFGSRADLESSLRSYAAFLLAG